MYTHFPYLVSDNDLKQLEANGISHSEQVIHVELSFQDLPTKYSRESERHRALKKVAYEMLQKLGEDKPQYEYAYYDVYSPSLNIVIECGDTRLDKLLEAFFRWFKTDLKEFWNLDYPDAEGNAELQKFKKR
jgi:hypothetical protein